MGKSEDMDAALRRAAAGAPKKQNDQYLLREVQKEISQRGSNYRAWLAGNRKSPN